jgi:hypothetical protein
MLRTIVVSLLCLTPSGQEIKAFLPVPQTHHPACFSTASPSMLEKVVFTCEQPVVVLGRRNSLFQKQLSPALPWSLPDTMGTPVLLGPYLAKLCLTKLGV